MFRERHINTVAVHHAPLPIHAAHIHIKRLCLSMQHTSAAHQIGCLCQRFYRSHFQLGSLLTHSCPVLSASASSMQASEKDQ